jgi:hypothetical protein
MTRGASKPRRWFTSPSVAFALAFALLGWIAGHSIAYDIMGLLPHDHHGHHEPQTHGYLDTLRLTGSVALVLAFGLSLRAFFQRGSFGEWLREGGIAGNRKQVVLAMALPASVFILVEHLERLIAGTGTTPPARLLAVGVLVQLGVGLLCLALVRLAFRAAEQVFVSLARIFLSEPVGTPYATILRVSSLCAYYARSPTRRPAGRHPSQLFLADFPTVLCRLCGSQGEGGNCPLRRGPEMRVRGLDRGGLCS